MEFKVTPPEIGIYYLFWHLHQQSRNQASKHTAPSRRKNWMRNPPRALQVFRGCLHILWPVIVYIVQISLSRPHECVSGWEFLIATSFAHFTKTSRRVIQGVTALHRLKAVESGRAAFNFEYRNVFIGNDNWQERESQTKWKIWLVVFSAPDRQTQPKDSGQH